jgi:hypothetical protein
MKAKKIAAIIFTALAGLMIGFSGIMKFLKNEEVVQTLTTLGVGNYITLLGVMEIVFVALFIIPKTMKIGFILLSCYFAGAMATELSHNGRILNPAILLILVWIAAFLRDRSIFLPAPESKNIINE